MAHRTPSGHVVLIVNAETDMAHQLAVTLLAEGMRVVVCAATTAALARILHRQSRSRVLAVAADLSDPWQRRRLCQRVLVEFGEVTHVVDGRTGECIPLRHTDVLAAA